MRIALGGRPFVVAGQRFKTIRGSQRAWAYYGAIVGLGLIGLNAVQAETILSLQTQLAVRQPIVVGLTTAHKIVPLFPDGNANASCDDLCIDGMLEQWIGSLRMITGERDPAQTQQHLAKDATESMVAQGSQAEGYVNRYYRSFDPFVLSQRGMKLNVVNAHVAAMPGTPGKFEAHWTDVVSNAATNQEMGRHEFSAYLDASANPTARNEQNVRHNPVGMLVTNVEQYGDTP